MKTITDIIAENPGATAAEVVALKNADPSRFKPVGSPAVLEWLGTNGRLVKLNGFVAQASGSNDPQTLAVVGAVQTVLIAAGNPSAYLSLDPTSQQVALLYGLVQLGVLTSDDAGALIDKAKTDADVTEADVATVRARMARQTEVDALLAPIRDAWNEFNADADVYVRDGGTLPTWGIE